MGSQVRATLSSNGGYTCFSFRDHAIRFRTSDALERYIEVLEWNRGYLVVMAKYSDAPQPEEEYVDLVPILRNLYFDPDEFLAPIGGVDLV